MNKDMIEKKIKRKYCGVEYIDTEYYCEDNDLICRIYNTKFGDAKINDKSLIKFVNKYIEQFEKTDSVVSNEYFLKDKILKLIKNVDPNQLHSLLKILTP